MGCKTEERNIEPNVPICQSCGMPMEKSEDFGTNVDRGKNKDYCRSAFRKKVNRLRYSYRTDD